ncbi:MAG: hypothetical protein RIB79_13900 [Allomuricauda sp.]
MNFRHDLTDALFGLMDCQIFNGQLAMANVISSCHPERSRRSSREIFFWLGVRGELVSKQYAVGQLAVVQYAVVQYAVVQFAVV